MSFREKTHWAALVALLAAFGWYFIHFPWETLGTRAGLAASAGGLTVVTIIFLVLMTVATAIMAIRAPKEANLKEDERDRTIHWRGTHVAYYPLVLGCWVNVAVQFYRPTPAQTLQMMVATVVLAEILRVAVQIWFYRRGY